jgi:gas vesicle protein
VNEDAAYFRTIRAIWSPDFGTDREMPSIFKERPFRTSLNRRDRHEIVQLTSDYNMKDTKEAPVEVKRFMMTSLGAWADMTGAWDPMGSDGLDVEQWIQRGTQGRDHFVRVCYNGFLFPFGHRATLVKETERKFRRTPRGDMAAYLMQRLYIIVRQRVRDFPADGLAGQRYQGRDFPFRSVEITTKVTPNLNLPVKLISALSDLSFWPQFTTEASTQDVMWTCIGKDWDGKEAHFSTPLTFIANTDATNDADLKTWVDGDYQTNAVNKKRRAVPMGGQGIAFAPSTKVGDTTLPVETLTLNGYYSDTVPTNTVRFFPWMEKSAARIEKVDELLGTQTAREVSFAKQFLDFAFEAGSEVKKAGQAVNAAAVKNPSQIFLKLLQTAAMDFGAKSDKAGGLAAPSIDIAGLSRLMGPIAGKVEAGINSLEDIANSAAAAGSFDPMEYFGSLLSTKILGDITLKDVLDFVQDLLNNMDKMPGLDKKDEFGIKESADEIKTFANDVKGQVQGIANDVAQEVKEARDALIAEVDKVKNEIQGYINAGKEAVEDRVKEWKKAIEDKLSELKSEVDKAIKPLKDAGNEAYKKYEEAQGFLNDLKKGLQLVYEWQTEIKSSPGNILVPLYPGTMDKDKKAILYLKAEMVKKLDLNPPVVKIYGSLSNFVINLIGDGAAQFLIIKFNYLKVSAVVGEKPNIDPSIEDVAFAGPLTFVNKLRDLIPKGGGGGGGGVSFSFDFDVKPSGITASLTIGLPNVTVGVF